MLSRNPLPLVLLSLLLEWTMGGSTLPGRQGGFLASFDPFLTSNPSTNWIGDQTLLGGAFNTNGNVNEFAHELAHAIAGCNNWGQGKNRVSGFCVILL